MSLPDPYTPGQVPRVLAGRVVEQARIRDQLARVSTFGELGGPLLVFHAPRGLGKTSLLRTAQRQATELGFVSVWVACSREQSFLAELVRGVERSLERAEIVPAGARRRWKARLDKVGLEFGLPGVKVRADLGNAGAPASQPPTGNAPIAALEDLLHDAARLVRDRGGAGLLVFLDELHAASAHDMALLLNTLQNLDGEREQNPLAVVSAGLPVTPEALTRAATFGERSAFVPLDLLSSTDARSAITAPAEALGVTWSAAALDAVVGEARGHPYLLQLLGSATWRAVAPEEGRTVSIADVRLGIPEASAQLDAMYSARWGAATPREQEFLRAMAAAGDGNVSRAQIAGTLGVSSQAISVPRERLIEKGVIEPVGHGLVRFTLPGFGDYVRERAPDAG
jgi:AAA ATPase domain